MPKLIGSPHELLKVIDNMKSGLTVVLAGAVSLWSVPDAFATNAPVRLAQAQVQPAAAAPQAAQLSSDQFVRGAIAIVQSLDAGAAAQIYDAASATMKRSVTKESFVKAVAASNARIGRIAQRDWSRVERLSVAAPAAGAPGPAVPAGNYVTVFIVAQNAAGASHLEQVSFRLDEDNQWRFSGATTHIPEPNRR